MRLAQFAVSIPLAVSAVLAMAGCNAIKYEFNTDGGYVAHVSDNLLDAPNKRWQVYRAAVALMLVTTVAESDLEDVNSIGSFYLAAKAVNDDINNLAGHVYPQTNWYAWNVVAVSKAKPKGEWPDHSDVNDTDPRPKIKQPLYPVASFRAPPVESSYPVNYVDLFQTDLPRLNDHLFKAAASATRKDKFLAAISDAIKGGASPLSTAWIVMKDAFDLTGEIIASEVRVAAAYRAEKWNRAAIFNGDFGTLKDSGCDKSNFTSNKTLDPDNILCQASQVTTQDAVEVLKTPRIDGTSPIGKNTDVSLAAYNQIYTVIRKSCRALRSRLPKAPETDRTAVKVFAAHQELIHCDLFALSPNVYRADYGTTPDDN